MNFGLALYGAVASAAFPLIKGRLARSHAEGFDERCGIYSDEKLKYIREAGGGKNLWFHAVSVGEVQAAGPIIRAALAAGWDGSVTLSTVTTTGAAVASKSLGSDIAAHIYAPWDVPSIVARACDALRPSAYVTVETEVWPNLLLALKRRGVPAFLANARVSDRTWEKKGLLVSAHRSAYGLFDMVMARGEEDARRLRAFGLPDKKIIVTGDSKIDAILARRDSAANELSAIRKNLALGEGSRLFVAGSTHEGEDEVVLDAFARLKKNGDADGARLVIAPRHPERAGEVLALASKLGIAARYSELDKSDEKSAPAPPDSPQIIVVDVIGVLYALYGLADAAFIGGSLVPKGGQNILEPASWGVPVLHGPHMEDFAEPTRQLDESGDAVMVEDAAGMAGALKKILSERNTIVGAQTLRPLPKYFEKNAGAATRAWECVKNYMSSF